MNKNKIILVCYLDVTGIDDNHINDYLDSITRRYNAFFDDDVRVIYVPKRGCGQTTIECINPVEVGKDEYDRISKMVDGFTEELHKREGEYAASNAWFSDGINVLGRTCGLTCEQLRIAVSIDNLPEKNFIFNLTRQLGFTTLMLNYAFSEAERGKNVCYITHSFNAVKDIENIVNEMGVNFYHAEVDDYGRYFYEGKGEGSGKVIMMGINRRSFLPAKIDICIFDNADFYENYVLEYYTNELLKKKGVKIIIGSCPNVRSDIFGSYYKRLWLDSDNIFSRKEITGTKYQDLLDLFTDKEYDFECNNASEYFKKIKPLYEKIKGE